MVGDEAGLHGARILVVGASSGIGRATAAAAVEAGAEVVFAARRARNLAEAAAATGGGGAVILDVREPTSVEAGIGQAVQRLGGLDVLVYAAGTATLETLDRQTQRDWIRVVETNAVGAALVAEAAIPRLAANGVAVFVSSIAAERARPGLVAYGASKAALDHVIEGLRVEHPATQVMRVVLGDTSGTEFADEFDPARFGELGSSWIAGGHLYSRQMDAVEVGRALVELVALARVHAGVSFTDVRLEPPGGRMSGSGTTEST